MPHDAARFLPLAAVRAATRNCDIPLKCERLLSDHCAWPLLPEPTALAPQLSPHQHAGHHHLGGGHTAASPPAAQPGRRHPPYLSNRTTSRCRAATHSTSKSTLTRALVHRAISAAFAGLHESKLLRREQAQVVSEAALPACSCQPPHWHCRHCLLVGAGTPDITWLVAGCMDKRVRIWHIKQVRQALGLASWCGAAASTACSAWLGVAGVAAPQRVAATLRTAGTSSSTRPKQHNAPPCSGWTGAAASTCRSFKPVSRQPPPQRATRPIRPHGGWRHGWSRLSYQAAVKQAGLGRAQVHTQATCWLSLRWTGTRCRSSGWPRTSRYWNKLAGLIPGSLLGTVVANVAAGLGCGRTNMWAAELRAAFKALAVCVPRTGLDGVHAAGQAD